MIFITSNRSRSSAVDNAMIGQGTFKEHITGVLKRFLDENASTVTVVMLCLQGLAFAEESFYMSM